MAHAIFERLVAEAGLSDQISIDSCGTGEWHLGEPVHRGTQRILAEHGIDFQHLARPLVRKDLQEADYLIAMDSSNFNSIRREGHTEARVALLLDYAEGIEETEVPDPYYTGNFEHVYRLIEKGARGLLRQIRAEHRL